MGLIILGSCSQCGRYGACVDILEYVGGVGQEYHRYCARWRLGTMPGSSGAWVYDYGGCEKRQAAQAEATKEG